MYKLLIVDDEQIEREGMHILSNGISMIYSCAAQHGMELMHLGRFKRMCRI